MVIFGVTTNPIPMLQWMNENKIRYTLNSVFLFKKVAVFSDVFNLNIRKYNVTKKKVIVFDAEERLSTIKDVKLITSKNISTLYDALLDKKIFPEIEELSIVPVFPILESIENNKSMGVLHTYNTAFYSIPKDIRDKLKVIVLNYVSGHISLKDLNSSIEKIVQQKRNGKTTDTVANMVNLVNGEEFAKIRLCVIDLIKANKSKKIERSVVESACLINSAEPFDVHYFYSVITESKNP